LSGTYSAGPFGIAANAAASASESFEALSRNSAVRHSDAVPAVTKRYLIQIRFEDRSFV